MTPQIEPASATIAILVKGENRTGILRLDVGTGGTLLGVNDEGTVRQSPCQSPVIGRHLFHSSVATSVEAGWRVGFLGKPNNAANS